MILGYNTNGLAHHDPQQAIELIHGIGYRSIAITIDHLWINPNRENHKAQMQEIRDLLRQKEMKSVIETGARFLLDPKVKHEPTLISPDASERSRRVDFLKYCVDLAAEMDSDCVSLWSGILREDIDRSAALERLAEGLEQVLNYADDRNVNIGFEPEPGMLIDSLSSFEALLQWVDSPRLKLTLDIGHLFCQGEFPIRDYIFRYQDRLVNVHIEDMKAGVHEHLMFGEGQIDFPPIIDGLKEANYQGGIHVELSRHSHDAANIAKRAFDFLSPLCN